MEEPVRIASVLALCLASVLILACNSSLQTNSTPNPTDRDRDGLAGPVKAVLTDDVILVEQNGQWLEGQQASSTSVYDESGKRTVQTPFRISLLGGHAVIQYDPMFNPQAKRQTVEEPTPIGGGKWSKNYDQRGYLTEGVRSDAGGKRVESLSVNYEFDEKGNWIKRKISRSREGDKAASSQFTEISYRQIVYFNSNPPAGNRAGIIAADAKQLKNPIAATEENIARGGVLYNQKCAACHGEDGKSQTAFAAAMPAKPEDLTGENVRALAEGEIYSVISSGVGPAGMPSFKGRISAEALWQITLYVRQLPVNKAGQATIASSTPAPSSQSKATAEQRYQFKGKVVSVERDLKQVTVEHEEIKGYMGAMTMPFPLKDEKILGKIKQEDRIEATLVVDGNGWRLENVVIK